MALIPFLLLLLTLIWLANIAAASPRSNLRYLVWGVLALLNLSALAVAAFSWQLLRLPPEYLADYPYNTEMLGAFIGPLAAAAIWGLFILIPPVRHLLARFTPLNPESPVHDVALVLAGYLVANTLITLNQGGSAALAEASESATLLDLFVTGAALIAAAFLGVGWGTRRSWKEIKERLGLRPLRRVDVTIAIIVTAGLFIAQIVVTLLLSQLYPEQMALLEEVNTVLLGEFNTLWAWLLLALATGIGEELLFRGAIQPAFGLIPTSALFALAHLQYDLSPLMLFIFILGLVLGIIRHRYGTSVAILIHFGYNFSLGILSLLAEYLV